MWGCDRGRRLCVAGRRRLQRRGGRRRWLQLERDALERGRRRRGWWRAATVAARQPDGRSLQVPHAVGPLGRDAGEMHSRPPPHPPPCIPPRPARPAPPPCTRVARPPLTPPLALLLCPPQVPHATTLQGRFPGMFVDFKGACARDGPPAAAAVRPASRAHTQPCVHTHCTASCTCADPWRHTARLLVPQVVCFPRSPKPHEVDADWIRLNW